MKINGKIQFKYKNNEHAKTVYDSLEIDNKGYIDSIIKENEIIYTLSSSSLGSFLATIDDLIASEIVVEKIIISTNKIN